jgi:hypothetical protein
MNDITALMATMKAAAERALQGEWEYEARAIWNTDENGWVQHMAAVDAGDDVSDEEHKQNMQFITTATPANVKTLVDALEKAQQHEQEWKSLCEAAAVDLDDWREIDDKSRGLICKLADAVIAKSERIAELESRTVTVKLPEPHAHLIWIQAGHAPDDYWDDVAVSHSEKDRCCDGSERYPVYAQWEIEEMLSAAGVQVIEGEQKNV